MPGTGEAEARTTVPGEQADPTALGRRRARFTYLMRRARRDVEGDPPLTHAEREELARTWAPWLGGQPR